MKRMDRPSSGLWRCEPEVDWRKARRAWTVLRSPGQRFRAAFALGSVVFLLVGFGLLCLLWSFFESPSSPVLRAMLTLAIVAPGLGFGVMAGQGVALGAQHRAMLILAFTGQVWLGRARALGMDEPELTLPLLERRALDAAKGLSKMDRQLEGQVVGSYGEQESVERAALAFGVGSALPEPRFHLGFWIMERACRQGASIFEMNDFLDEPSSVKLAQEGYPAVAATLEAQALLESLFRPLGELAFRDSARL